MKTIIITFLLIFSSQLQAKRMPPANIAPIISKHGIIEHHFVRGTQGFSVYVQLKSKGGEIKWKSRLFSGKYIPNLETDVQDIHLKKMYLEYPYVYAVDEKDKSYQLDMANGTLIQPKKPAEY